MAPLGLWDFNVTPDGRDSTPPPPNPPLSVESQGTMGRGEGNWGLWGDQGNVNAALTSSEPQ